MSNIHGFGSLPSSSSSKKDEKDNEFFTSQGKTSGTGVYRPKNRNDDILNQARNNADNTGSNAPPSVATVTLYANGFQVNDQNFRDSSDPQNAKFIEELRSGVVPRELERDLRVNLDPSVREVGVQLVDRSKQVFDVPPPKFDFARSSGRTLGTTQSDQDSNGIFVGAIPTEIQVDESQPSTTVQIVLPNRKRLRVKFNHHHTVLDVYQHVQFVGGINGPFSLVAGFPPKKLTDSAVSLKEGGLIGASINVKV